MSNMLTCPYCYETFAARQMLFRCNGRPSRTNKRCSLKLDQVLADQTGARLELPPVFRADGRKGAAACPECGSETTYKVCPFCHSLLPTHFGHADSRVIAMAGAKGSGKTTYMTVLLHEMMNRVGSRFRAAVVSADDETRMRFVQTYEDPLFREHRMLAPTRSAGNGARVTPLVFRLSVAPSGWLASRPVNTLLSFFDSADVEFSGQRSADVTSRYLTRADGILLLLDPLQLAGAQSLVASGVPLPVAESYEMPLNVLSRATDILLAKDGHGRRAKISKPIAIVFTKIDAMWHGLDRVSPLRTHPPEGPRFDTADSLSVHEEIRHLLREWDCEIDQFLQSHYTHYRYFGISSLGQPPTKANDVAPSGIQPYRVADPLLWILSEFGTVPRTEPGLR